MPFADRVRDWQDRIESALAAWLPASDAAPAKLHAAMRYSVLGGGKRIRPILVYATGETFDVPAATLDGPACAVEMIHAYSLIHDDLPAMDNDDLRRGKPTCHRAFDEATAILAGDALQALAFDVLASDTALEVTPLVRVRMMRILAAASGSLGMAGGQAIDLAAVGSDLTVAQLENMHVHKTGALIRASVLLGALCHPGLGEEEFAPLSQYAHFIGLAFQIKDDILDVEVDTATLGKPQGSDLAQNKPTYPRLLGLEGAKREAQRLHDEAQKALRGLGPTADGLRWVAEYIVSRGN
ncbi:MAG: (2E,6E)-farnesyl diphosphate synthase [Gammaproteobacteria bacterium]|nr:(2E,6E)-farnesyl diphosphate synthase [Gammaproteobacteria bacterium]